MREVLLSRQRDDLSRQLHDALIELELTTTANGQTEMVFTPAPAAGGTNNFLALYNAYNRIKTEALCRDSNTSWTYASATWRTADNSESFRISYLDGLAESLAFAAYESNNTAVSASSSDTGVLFDAISGTPGQTLGYKFFNTVSLRETRTEGRNSLIALGLRYAQAMEARTVGSGTITFGINASRCELRLNIDM